MYYAVENWFYRNLFGGFVANSSWDFSHRSRTADWETWWKSKADDCLSRVRSALFCFARHLGDTVDANFFEPWSKCSYLVAIAVGDLS